MKIEEQVQWILMYIQGGSADVYKKNLLKEMEAREVQFALVRDFLAESKREFGEDNDELTQVAELKRLEQKGKTIKKFV